MDLTDALHSTDGLSEGPTVPAAGGSRPLTDSRTLPGAVGRYFVLTYVAVLIHTAAYLTYVQYVGAITVAFAWSAWLTYALLYTVPTLLPTALLVALAGRSGGGMWRRRLRRGLLALAVALAVLLPAGLQFALFVDRLVFRLYRFHLDNGFVWNLVTTPGGIASMQAGRSTQWTFVAIGAGFAGLQAALLAASAWVGPIRRAGRVLLTKRKVLLAGAVVTLLSLFHIGAYGVSDFVAYTPVLSASNALPLFVDPTFKKLGKKLGYEPVRQQTLDMQCNATRLNYPLRPIERTANPPRYNVVYLVSESWRADTLTREVMPRTRALADRSLWFRHHYSGGHGTREGMFSLFYGLDGSYWDLFRQHRRDPVLLDTLLDDGYSMHVYSSAEFCYPEFDETIFSRLPAEQLHPVSGEGITWKEDRAQITRLLDSLDKRDRSRPFFAFMFLDSPHCAYYFPPECAVFKPYAKDINYASMDVKKDIGLIRNRYLNACHHLDTQIARIMDYLDRNHLLDDTLVVITGDHGEAFMERGVWGHNAGFDDGEIRVPLLLHVPGQSPAKIDRMTSHVDVAPTVLKLLGVTNPPGDYSVGLDLLGPDKRTYAVCCGWGKLAYLDSDYKAVFPKKSYRFSPVTVTTADDKPVSNPDEFHRTRRTALLRVLEELARFGR